MITGSPLLTFPKRDGIDLIDVRQLVRKFGRPCQTDRLPETVIHNLESIGLSPDFMTELDLYLYLCMEDEGLAFTKESFLRIRKDFSDWLFSSLCVLESYADGIYEETVSKMMRARSMWEFWETRASYLEKLNNAYAWGLAQCTAPLGQMVCPSCGIVSDDNFADVTETGFCCKKCGFRVPTMKEVHTAGEKMDRLGTACINRIELDKMLEKTSC